MRKISPVLMIIPLLLALSACKGQATERRAENILAYHAALTRFSWNGVLRVDYGDRVLDFGLNSDFSEGMTTLEVTSPEMLRGVKATLGAETSVLEYDGVILETGTLPGTGLSPLEIIPLMQQQWSSGYAVHESEEKLKGTPCRRVTFARGNLELSVWFGSQNEPVVCELAADGVMTARLTIERFTAG